MKLSKRLMSTLPSFLGLTLMAFLFQNCAQEYSLESGSIYKKSSATKNVSNDGITDTMGNTDDVDGDVVSTPEGKEPLNDDDIAKIDECEDAQSKLDLIPEVEDGQNIENLSGSNIFKIKNLKYVGNISGKLILIGLGSESLIEELGNVSGLTILCGVSVTHLSNKSGATWIHSGNVGILENASGNIRVYGGKIGTMSNVSGTVTAN